MGKIATLNNQEAFKRAAAAEAAKLVEDGMTLGLGTGSTAARFIRLLGDHVRDGLRVRGIPTSNASAKLAQECGVAIVGFDDIERIDLCVDGVDEIDGDLRAIKGGGGALLREKIVAAASDRVVYIADASKRVDILGAFPLPVEIVPFAAGFLRRRIATLGCEPVLRLEHDDAPFRTDEGNLILDCPFGQIADPEMLGAELTMLPGVVEHGLFLGLIDSVILADATGVARIDRPIYNEA
jgi:ribose 5-phosphate isomerase A